MKPTYEQLESQLKDKDARIAQLERQALADLKEANAMAEKLKSARDNALEEAAIFHETYAVSSDQKLFKQAPDTIRKFYAEAIRSLKTKGAHE